VCSSDLLSIQHLVIKLGKLFRRYFDQGVIPCFINVLFIRRELTRNYSFKGQYTITSCMRLEDRIPDDIHGVSEISDRTNPKVVIFGKKLRESSFPESMNSLLTGKLSIVITCRMQGHVDISYVVSEVGR